MRQGSGRPETILVKYERALSPIDILTSNRVPRAQNYVFVSYDRALRGRKIFLSSRNVLVDINIFLEDLTGPWNLHKSDSLKGPWVKGTWGGLEV